MTATEDQLRDALHGIAELVHERPVPSAEPKMFSQWLTPVAVAAAVTAVIVAGVITATVLHESGKHPALAGPSRHFLALIVQGTGPDGASVRDARTGRVTAQVRLPAGMQEWTAASATADDRVFFLAASLESGSGVIFKLTLGDEGKVAGLTKVRGTEAPTHLRFIAASPDGSRVAFPVDKEPRGGGAFSGVPGLEEKIPTPARPDVERPKSAPPPAQGGFTPNRGDIYGPARIDVVTVGTGRRETFLSKTAVSLESLSWSGDGRRLGFAFGNEKDGRTGAWVLDPVAGGDLLAHAQQVKVTGDLVSPVLGPDGSTMYMIVSQDKGRVTELIEVDVRTGQRLRTLLKRPHTTRSWNTIWQFTDYALDPGSGQLLVVLPSEKADPLKGTIEPAEALRIDPRTGTTTGIPFPGGQPHGLVW